MLVVSTVLFSYFCELEKSLFVKRKIPIWAITMKKNILYSILLVAFFSTYAQSKKEVLMTVDGTPIYTKEFVSVYNKNLDLVQDESQKTVDGYLDLFVDYKLKVAVAYDQKLNENPAYLKEYKKYRDQLSRNYLYETKVAEDLAVEAYERSQEDINANHILIRVGYDAVPQDTLVAYNKIKQAYDSAKAGEDFVKLVQEYSEEPGAKERDGALGWFTAFSMVYPFESMAYKTPAGEVSEIVRTSFGYHIIRVNKRRESSAEITVSHIMISDKNKEQTFNPEERINELYQLTQQGSDFAELAKQFSDDKGSGRFGGKLKRFSKGQLRSDKFEEAAYSLQNAGDISKPVKSSFGWHIIRLEEKHTKPSYQEQQPDIISKVQKGGRMKVVSATVNKKIKDTYGFKDTEYLPFFESWMEKDSLLQKKWKYKLLTPSQNNVLFTIGDTTIYYDVFAKYMEGRQKSVRSVNTVSAMVQAMYDEFETQQLKEYFMAQLEIENEEYAGVINEYRDGLLIFDVMKKNVWDKAKLDTIGLEKHYQKMGANFKWKERIDAAIFSGTNKIDVEKAQQLLKDDKTPKEIKETLNDKDNVRVLLSEGLFEKGTREVPSNVVFEAGVSAIENSNGRFYVLKINEVIPPSVKTYDDVKGRVISDYQNFIEEEWMQSLRDTYDVKINKKALKKVKKQLK